MRYWNTVELMSDKDPTVKTYNAFERAALACFLVLFLASVGMVTYYGVISATNPDVDFMDSIFWQFTITALISMMAGFLFGVNRSK